MLDPHTDWRVIADAVRAFPPCAVCGDVYGNMAFGAEHYTADMGMRMGKRCCTGYVPVEPVDGQVLCGICHGTGWGIPREDNGQLVASACLTCGGMGGLQLVDGGWVPWQPAIEWRGMPPPEPRER